MQPSLDDNAGLLKAYQDRDPKLSAALIRSNHMNAFAALEKCFTCARSGIAEGGDTSA
jgi:hypothetical protein